MESAHCLDFTLSGKHLAVVCNSLFCFYLLCHIITRLVTCSGIAYVIELSIVVDIPLLRLYLFNSLLFIGVRANLRFTAVTQEYVSLFLLNDGSAKERKITEWFADQS